MQSLVLIVYEFTHLKAYVDEDVWDLGIQICSSHQWYIFHFYNPTNTRTYQFLKYFTNHSSAKVFQSIFPNTQFSVQKFGFTLLSFSEPSFCWSLDLFIIETKLDFEFALVPSDYELFSTTMEVCVQGGSRSKGNIRRHFQFSVLSCHHTLLVTFHFKHDSGAQGFGSLQYFH